jgi:hypothetical protein
MYMYILFNKLPKVNTHPMGENSANLVTLHTYLHMQCV